MKRLIENATVLTSKGAVTHCSILFTDGTVTKVGDFQCADADETYDGTGKLAIPGLINCHTHAYMSAFRCIGDDLPFSEWLFDRIMPLEDLMTGDDAYWCTLLSCIEMIKSGTTCFVDMHMFENACAKAVCDIGMRAVMTRGLSGGAEIPGAERRMNEALREKEAFSGIPHIGFMLAPHSIYTCDTEYLKEIAARAKELGCSIHIHLSESLTEFNDCKAKHGMTPVEYAESVGIFDVPVLAAHCVHLTDNDIEILKKHGATVVTNPKSNLKLANGIAPVKALREAGVRVCIGTDSAASNNSLNMFSEMCFTALLQKGISGCSTAVPASDAFSFATVDASDALGMKSGLIEEGRDADIVLLDLKSANLNPVNDIVSSLVYCASGSEPESVFIDGKPVMLRRRILAVDENEVINKVNSITERIRGQANV